MLPDLKGFAGRGLVKAPSAWVMELNRRD